MLLIPESDLVEFKAVIFDIMGLFLKATLFRKAKNITINRLTLFDYQLEIRLHRFLIHIVLRLIFKYQLESIVGAIFRTGRAIRHLQTLTV